MNTATDVQKDRRIKFRSGSRVSGCNAETASAELDRIREKFGKVVPANVVDESRSKRAPLHNVFEWNDGAAAQEYRLYQARTLIRAVVVEYVIPENGSKETFVSVNEYTHVGDAYIPTEIVVNDVDMLDVALDELREKLGQAQYSVSSLEAAVAVHAKRKKWAPRVARVKKAIASARKELEIDE